jgi:hypothetical protein
VPFDGYAVSVVDCPLPMKGIGGVTVTVRGVLTVKMAEEVVYVNGVEELSVTFAQ